MKNYAIHYRIHISQNVNEAKNQIILHLLNESRSNKGNTSSANNLPPSIKSYASVIKNNTPGNKIIIQKTLVKL